MTDAQQPPSDGSAPDAETEWQQPPPEDSNAQSAAVDDSTAETEWWDDPNLPWKHKPTRADVVCFSWLSVAAIYGIVISVLRPGLLGTAPNFWQPKDRGVAW